MEKRKRKIAFAVIFAASFCFLADTLSEMGGSKTVAIVTALVISIPFSNWGAKTFFHNN